MDSMKSGVKREVYILIVGLLVFLLSMLLYNYTTSVALLPLLI